MQTSKLSRRVSALVKELGVRLLNRPRMSGRGDTPRQSSRERGADGDHPGSLEMRRLLIRRIRAPRFPDSDHRLDETLNWRADAF